MQIHKPYIISCLPAWVLNEVVIINVFIYQNCPLPLVPVVTLRPWSWWSQNLVDLGCLYLRQRTNQECSFRRWYRTRQPTSMGGYGLETGYWPSTERKSTTLDRIMLSGYYRLEWTMFVLVLSRLAHIVVVSKLQYTHVYCIRTTKLIIGHLCTSIVASLLM